MDSILLPVRPISMKNSTYLLILLSFFVTACGSSVSHIFGKKTPHEKYADTLEDTGAANSPEGRLWLAAAEKAITHAQPVSLPYRLKGYFQEDKPRALGLSFTAKRGERIQLELTRDEHMALYADLFQLNEVETRHVQSIEPGNNAFSFDVAETGNYIIRLQPGIAVAGNFALAMNVGPSLDFPVTGTKARVGSVWGDSRDGGKRSHEGIDIFAPKKTPVVAIADGYISSVKNGGLGGKTVNLRPTGTNYSLYYAHLDEQLVTEGQYVKKGEVLGTVGNTGNARTTPPHLHFGIYTYGGAIDPLPFVNRVNKKASALPAKEIAGHHLKLLKTQKSSRGENLAMNTTLVPIAVTAKGYIAEDDNGFLHHTPFNAVKAVRTINSSTAIKQNSERENKAL